ncbi:hypothetical protein [Planctomicrobium sp. SH664]|uniref:hypothetical protein n=1 Tax=Planctomicrobium sp. SH664 TaxID=3448125 RepID=UPI003F5C4E92
MFFRIGIATLIVTIISLMAITLEKQQLEYKRAISLQHYSLELLKEKRSRLILTTQRLGSPARLIEERERLEQERAAELRAAARSRKSTSRSREATGPSSVGSRR